MEGDRKSFLSAFPIYENVDTTKIFLGVDALRFETVEKVIRDSKPDVVINCIGLIKQLKEASDALLSIELNSVLPLKLSKLSTDLGIKLIHFSTDND